MSSTKAIIEKNKIETNIEEKIIETNLGKNITEAAID